MSLQGVSTQGSNPALLYPKQRTPGMLDRHNSPLRDPAVEVFKGGRWRQRARQRSDRK